MAFFHHSEEPVLLSVKVFYIPTKLSNYLFIFTSEYSSQPHGSKFGVRVTKQSEINKTVLTLSTKCFILLSTKECLVNKRDLRALYISGTPITGPV